MGAASPGSRGEVPSGRQQDLAGRAELGWVTGVQAGTKSGQGRRRSAWGQRSEEEESQDRGCGDG